MNDAGGPCNCCAARLLPFAKRTAMQLTSSHVSETTRVTTAREARFRTDAPNSIARRIAVVALDPGDREIAHYRAHHHNADVQFFDAHAFGSGVPDQQLDAADIVVVVGQEGADAQLGERVADFCSTHGRLLTCLIRRAPLGRAAPHKTTATLRPRSSMMVVVNGVGYLNDLLEALGG
jgi:hypothetical protein